MLLNCRRMGDIFSQLAKVEIMLNCSSSERSMKLIGSISSIFRYRPSVVSTTPCCILFTGRNPWAVSFFAFFLFAFFFRVILVTNSSHVYFSSIPGESQHMAQTLKQRIPVNAHDGQHPQGQQRQGHNNDFDGTRHRQPQLPVWATFRPRDAR